MSKYLNYIKQFKKPHIAFLLVCRFIVSRLKTIIYQFKYILLNPRNKIKGTVRFNQKTVLSGCGTVELRNNVRIGYKIGGFFWNGVSEFQARYPDSSLLIKQNTAINNSCLFVAANNIEIGENCRIGANVTMMDYEAHRTNPEERSKVGDFGEIIIGNNVWIGNNVILLKNVIIGNNSIVGAGSVVLKGNYPENCIIGGNPAKVVKSIC